MPHDYYKFLFLIVFDLVAGRRFRILWKPQIMKFLIMAHHSFSLLFLLPHIPSTFYPQLLQSILSP